MPVYVDELFKTTPTKKWLYSQACHLTADTADDLHAFATLLGLKRSWAQHEGRDTLHYDLTPGKRSLALAQGAIFVPGREQARRRIAARRAVATSPA